MEWTCHFCSLKPCGVATQYDHDILMLLTLFRPCTGLSYKLLQNSPFRIIWQKRDSQRKSKGMVDLPNRPEDQRRGVGELDEHKTWCWEDEKKKTESQKVSDNRWPHSHVGVFNERQKLRVAFFARIVLIIEILTFKFRITKLLH